MKVYDDINSIPEFSNAVVTSGFFDGVHKGHQRIIARLKEIAQKNCGTVVVITFWPHPKLVLNPNNSSLKLLNTFEEKVELLKKYGVENLIKIPFTKAFSEMTSEGFIKDVLVRKIKTQKLVIGYDHRFGKNREGSFQQLQGNSTQYGFDVEEIPREDIDHVGIGSSMIRKALLEGRVEAAARFLGQFYSLTGKVIRGDKIGRIIGFPTANLEIYSTYKLIPKKGIYAVKISHKGIRYGGMLYIGTRPTLNGKSQSVEVNMFDFNKDIYGEKITIDLIALIRKDMRFDNLEALKTQIERDKNISMSLLNKKHPI